MWVKRRSTRTRIAALVTLVALALIMIPGGVTPSSTVVSCTRSAFDQGRSSLCTATVFGFSPTGSVVWSPSGSGNLTFSSTWCTLSMGQCEVTANGTNAGKVTSDAMYLGDANNYFSSSGDTLTVYQSMAPPVISATPATVNSGGGSTLTPTTRFGGGAPPYTCRWLQESPGVTSFIPLSARLACDPSSLRSIPTGPLKIAGVWLFELQVTDSSGERAVSASVAVRVIAPTTVHSSISVYCSPSTIRLAFLSVPFQNPPSAACTVVVRGNSLTGLVKWSANATGSLDPSTCVFSQTPVSYGTCVVNYTPFTSDSPVAITAVYGEDPLNPAMSATAQITVESAISSTSVSCLQSIDLKQKVSCSVVVDGYDVTGNVTWSQTGTGLVSFASSTCILREGFCSVTVTGLRTGVVVIHASYGGDSANTPSKSHFTLTVKPACYLKCV